MSGRPSLKISCVCWVGFLLAAVPRLIKSGHPQTPFLLEVFLDNLIGIAARVSFRFRTRHRRAGCSVRCLV
jgi:hypothetical protein